MIRTLDIQDRDKIKAILVDTGNFHDYEIDIAMELIDVYINDRNQKDYFIFVDEDGGVIRGYVCVGPRPMTKSTYDLYWIAVNPSVQSKGIGSTLVKYAEDFIASRGGKLILIETSGKPSYEKERHFYLKNSYDKITEIKDFYDEGDSLVIYGKYIKK
jgi:ribosomal protein S18 acetylase RimI-like enzyme